jgi:hypothetical protein
MFGALALGVTLPTFLLRRLENTYPTPHLLIVLMAVVEELAQAAIAWGTFENLRSRPTGLRTLFQISIRRSVPVIGLSIVYTVGTALGFIALIFPAFMAATTWFVAMPACVVEETGPIASLRRSVQLTKGYRWKVFSVVLIIAIIDLPSGIPALVRSNFGFVVVPIWHAAALAFESVLMAVVYHDLRVAKEGSDTWRIASVFE